jgi:hypothetical protein
LCSTRPLIARIGLPLVLGEVPASAPAEDERSASPPDPIVAAVGVSAPGHGDEELRLHLRTAMRQCLAAAFAVTRLPWTAGHQENRGDEILIGQMTHVPAEALMDPLAHHLNAALRRHNRLVSRLARLRLRMAVHAGPVTRDATGVAGPATSHLFGLLRSPLFKEALDESGADLGLIVSDRLYQDATRCAGLVDPAAYRPVRLHSEETSSKAWIWLPPPPPRPASG